MNTAWIRWFKLYCMGMGLVLFASAYLFACVWVGTDYSYSGGWFMFLAVLMMPIRFKKLEWQKLLNNDFGQK